jgi:hypothetical protein
MQNASEQAAACLSAADVNDDGIFKLVVEEFNSEVFESALRTGISQSGAQCSKRQIGLARNEHHPFG